MTGAEDVANKDSPPLPNISRFVYKSANLGMNSGEGNLLRTFWNINFSRH